jgi:hypothetical protein
MDAIVVVFMPTRDSRPGSEELVALRVVNPEQPRSGFENPKTALLDTSERTTPPFWTWFIENPRSCGA